jgi:RNA polymerase sigma factor (TIGR02999 family)
MPLDAPTRQHATTLLGSLTRDGSEDPGELAAIMYGEMRALAAQLMANERAGHTLDPTALVNEAYLRIVNAESLDISSRDHFFMLAARVMRRILIDHARGVNRLKRGGDRERIRMTVSDAGIDMGLDPSELLAIDEALEHLRTLDERKARLVELRFFGGLDEETAARVLGIARSTASSDWRFARAWLMDRLSNRSRGEDA